MLKRIKFKSYIYIIIIYSYLFKIKKYILKKINNDIYNG